MTKVFKSYLCDESDPQKDQMVQYVEKVLGRKTTVENSKVYCVMTWDF